MNEQQRRQVRGRNGFGKLNEEIHGTEETGR